MQYSEELRSKVIERVLEGSSTHEALAEEFGVGRSTIQNWMRRYRRESGVVVSKKDKRPRDWSREARVEALLTTHGLSEDERGAWCRQHGVHSHHLVQWRRELVDGVDDKRMVDRELRELREELRVVKKELRRKESALAETAALLTLKKRAAAIWGDPEDD